MSIHMSMHIYGEYVVLPMLTENGSKQDGVVCLIMLNVEHYNRARSLEALVLYVL